MPVSSFETRSTPLTVSQVPDLGRLTIRSQRDDDTHVLALFGELDLSSAPAVDAELRCIEGAAPDVAEIVIDLRGVRFIDSTGLRLLVEASHRAGTATHRLRLLRPRPHVFRVCEIAGVAALLGFESVPTDA